ncbi:MAG: glycosyltransferase family 39 protein [bacterium]|nr:glycosyltransferase family 39 protein [bacterium]
MTGMQNIKAKLSVVIFLVIMTAGILLRLYNIGYNFDGDEVSTVSASSSTFSHMIERAVEDRSHPPLHLALLFIWIKIFGNSEASVRMLSVIASFLFLLTVYRLALLLCSMRTALFILLLCSLSPFLIYYGQHARPYSLLSFFSVFSLYLVLKYQEKPTRTKTIFYLLTCAALLYTSYLSIFVLLPQFIYAAFFNKQGGKKLFFYGATGVLTILYWIIFSSLLQNIGIIGEKISWVEKPNFLSLIKIFIEPFGWSPFPGASKWMIGIIGVVFVSLIINWRNINSKKAILLATLAFFGPVVILIISAYGHFSIWASRQMIGEIIFYIVLLGLALSTLPKWLRIILGLILISWCIVNIHNEFPENSKPPWRYMANLISEKYGGYYVVAEEGWVKDPLQYYMKEKVNYFNQEDIKNQRKAIFVCRPDKCDRLKDIQSTHIISDKKIIHWSGYERMSANDILVYSLEKKF